MIWSIFDEYITKVKCCINHLHFCYYETSRLNIGSCVQFGGIGPPSLDSAWNSGSDRCCPIFCSTILAASSPSMAEIVRISATFLRVPLQIRSSQSAPSRKVTDCALVILYLYIIRYPFSVSPNRIVSRGALYCKGLLRSI